MISKLVVCIILFSRTALAKLQAMLVSVLGEHNLCIRLRIHRLRLSGYLRYMMRELDVDYVNCLVNGL